MVPSHDYDRYRILDEVVRLPDLRILWAEVEGRRVQLVTAPPVPASGRLTVLRRLAEREALQIEGVCAYLASGVDDRRTWVAFAAADTPTLKELWDTVRAEPHLASPAVAARIVAEAAASLREVVKQATSLPAAGFVDARVAPDGHVVLGHLGEVVAGPKMDEAALVIELGRWLDRLSGPESPLAALTARTAAGAIRRLSSLADELDTWMDQAVVEGSGAVTPAAVTHAAVAEWVARLSAARPKIPPPALIDDPLEPEPQWASAAGHTPPPTTPMLGLSPVAGATIGPYRLVQRIANGMMGRVYEAVRLSDGKRVALKLLLPAEDDPAMLEEYQLRFRREVEALARLSHPNIVKVHEFGFDDEGWLAMDYVEGSTLAKILRTEGHLPVEDVVAIARQLCSALGHAHSNGVVHRDLKPANVILAGDDPRRVRLVDFGLAKDWNGSADVTNDGTLLGTPHYMSPEQCNGESARIESDLYALGMLMYRLLTGRMPFEGKRGAGILIAHMRSPVPAFSSLELSFEVPPAIEAVVMKCLEKQPENRFRSALALDFALRAALDGDAPPATPAPAPGGPDRWAAFFPLDRSGLAALPSEAAAVIASIAQRAGTRGLALSALAVVMVAILVVGGATSATLAWLFVSPDANHGVVPPITERSLREAETRPTPVTVDAPNLPLDRSSAPRDLGPVPAPAPVSAPDPVSPSPPPVAPPPRVARPAP
ncbi:MAG: serine/threonine-protein kinase, partial [Myxococcota bacterium]